MPTVPKPVDLQTGKISNAEKQAKRDAEVHLGELKYQVTPAVKRNAEAYKKWKEIVKLYKDAKIKFVSSSDVGTMSRYCLTYSEYLDLVAKRAVIADIQLPEEIYDPYFTGNLLDILGRVQAKKLWDLIEFMARTDGVLKLDKAINSKLKSLLDLENTLFLNPLAKIRSVPVQKVQKPKDEAADAGFDV